MKFIQKLSDILFSILIRIAQILLVIMVALVFTNVVLRYVFNSGIYWSEEASLVIVIWFTFIAFALGVKEDLHISISVLPRKMSGFITVFLTFFKSAVEIICGYIIHIRNKINPYRSLFIIAGNGTFKCIHLSYCTYLRSLYYSFCDNSSFESEGK